MQPIKKSIQLTTGPLEDLLENGEAIDFRLDEPQWAGLEIGDIIEFWEDKSGWDTSPAPDARKTIVTIIDIIRAKLFSDIINNPENATFFAQYDEDEIISALRQWWDRDQENKKGVLGLKVRLAKP